MLLITHLTLATSLLEHMHSRRKSVRASPGTPSSSASSSSPNPSSHLEQRRRRRRGQQRAFSPTPALEPPREARSAGGGTAEEKKAEGGDSAVPGCDSPWQERSREDVSSLWTFSDKVYVAGAGVVWVLGEVVHPWLFEEGTLPFLPLMEMSVFGALGVVACWGLSVAGCLSLLPAAA